MKKMSFRQHFLGSSDSMKALLNVPKMEFIFYEIYKFLETG